AKVCTSHALRSSSTEEPVIRPSTRRFTALLDDSTTVTLTIAIHISSELDKAIDMPFTRSGRVGAIPGIYRDRPIQYLSRINRLRRLAAICCLPSRQGCADCRLLQGAGLRRNHRIW